MTEANRQTIREAFDRWQDGSGAIADVFAPDMTWRIEGRSLASSQYGSKQQFIDEVLADPDTTASRSNWRRVAPG